MKLQLMLLALLTAWTAFAQEKILEQTAARLSALDNFSYRCVYKQKDAVQDTLVIDRRITQVKMPADRQVGYYFRHEYTFAGMRAPSVEIYKGTELLMLDGTDSTFRTRKELRYAPQELLTAKLQWYRDFYLKHPSKLSRVKDTLYHGALCNRLRLTTKDTLINGQRQFVYIDLFIDRGAGLPAGRMTRPCTTDFGKELSDYYTEESYSDYRINQVLPESLFIVPAGYHVPKAAAPQQPLLSVGSVAPDFTLEDTDGKRTTLSALRGRPVLLDFFFVGCVPCLKSLAPLDSIYKDYNKSGLALLSISDRDGKKAVTAFKKVQRITYPVFPEGGNVGGLYHVTAYPTLILIDRQGKIAMVLDSYSDELYKKLSAAIDGLMVRGNK